MDFNDPIKYVVRHGYHPEILNPDSIMDSIDKELKVDSTWKINEHFACGVCKSPARLHPQTNSIWGCLPCGYTTASVTHYFYQRTPTEIQTEGKRK